MSPIVGSSALERLGMLLIAAFSILLTAAATAGDTMLGIVAAAIYGIPGVTTVVAFALRQPWSASSARVVTMAWLIIGFVLATVIALWTPYAYRAEFGDWLEGSLVFPVLLFVGSPTIIRYVLGRAYGTSRPIPLDNVRTPPA